MIDACSGQRASLIRRSIGVALRSARFRERLQDALEESDLPFKVDLVDWHDISAEFQQLILKNYQVKF